jgi:hypothetical protein
MLSHKSLVEQRRQVKLAWRQLSNLIRRTTNHTFVNDDIALSFDIPNSKKYAPHLRGLRFILSAAVGDTCFRGAYDYSRGNQPAKIVINFGAARHDIFAGQDSEDSKAIESRLNYSIVIRDLLSCLHTQEANILWSEFVRHNVELILESIEVAFAHEYVHHLDVTQARRNHKRFLPKRMPTNDRSYFNLPFERRAFVQQALYQLDKERNGLKSSRQFYQNFGSNVHEFMSNKIPRTVNGKFVSCLYKKNRREISDAFLNYYLGADRNFLSR